MPNDTKKPSQNDQDVGWVPPKDDPAWKKIELYGKPPKMPSVPDWDELNPKVDGMTIVFVPADNLLKVLCGGLVYEINVDNLYPPIPEPEKPPADPCDPRKDGERKYRAEVKDIKYTAYFRQTKCLLQINCVVEYWIVYKTVRCDTSLKKWRPKGQPDPDGFYKTRASYFTCPCRD